MGDTHQAPRVAPERGLRTVGGQPVAASGFSLVELMVAMTILGVIAAMATPRFALALETAKLDNCSAQLGSIWLAQRMHWLEAGQYADTLGELRSNHLIDHVVATTGNPYSFGIDRADDTEFQARATRNASVWDGELTIDETGVVDGEIEDNDDRVLRPADF